MRRAACFRACLVSTHSHRAVLNMGWTPHFQLKVNPSESMAHCEKALRIMKTYSLLSALVISSLLSFGVNTWALDDHGDDQGDNNDDQGENCQGGHIDGSET